MGEYGDTNLLIVFTVQCALSSGVLADTILLAGDETLHKESIL